MDGRTKLSWLAAAQISSASSLKAKRVELAVWSYRGLLHPTGQEAQVTITKVYPAMSKVGSQLDPNVGKQINEWHYQPLPLKDKTQELHIIDELCNQSCL